MKTVLFIQHASNFGGSAISLLYMVKEIQNSPVPFKPIIALAKWNKKLSDFYEEHGIETVKPLWIDTYEHTTAVSYNLLNPLNWLKEIKQKRKINNSIEATKNLLKDINPDLVHLNSVVLIGSALACNKLNIPFVWHIREHSVKGLFQVRKNKLIRLLKTLPNKCFFICEADRYSWGNPQNGEVVYNFVDFQKFSKDLSPKIFVEGIAIPNSDFNILFLGGVNKIKGSLVLLKSFAKILLNYPNKNIKLIFAGGIYDSPNYPLYRIIKKLLPLLGLATYTQKIERTIKKMDLEKNIVRFPFTQEVPQLIANSNILVFPSVRPHFARPIIEAGSMAIPVVGSDLESVKELVEEGRNGLKCKPNDVDDLYHKIEYFLLNPEKAKEMGINGYKIAKERYDQKKNVQQILDIYVELLKNQK